jgi:hypothetical protein
MPRFHAKYYPKGKHGKYPSLTTAVDAPDVKSVPEMVRAKFSGASVVRIEQEYNDIYSTGYGTFLVYRSLDEKISDGMVAFMSFIGSILYHVVFPLLGLIGLIWLIKKIWYSV